MREMGKMVGLVLPDYVECFLVQGREDSFCVCLSDYKKKSSRLWMKIFNSPCFLFGRTSLVLHQEHRL